KARIRLAGSGGVRNTEVGGGGSNAGTRSSRIIDSERGCARRVGGKGERGAQAVLANRDAKTRAGVERVELALNGGDRLVDVVHTTGAARIVQSDGHRVGPESHIEAERIVGVVRQVDVGVGGCRRNRGGGRGLGRVGQVERGE